MSDETPGVRATGTYQIDDVFLVQTEYSVARDFNQTALIPEFLFGHQSAVEPVGYVQSRTPAEGGEEIYILRYFVNTEVRLIKPGLELGEREPVEGDFLAVLKFTLAADYRCPKAAIDDKEAIGAFSRNAHYHTWPYLREEVHAACARLRIPRITLPMIKLDQQGRVMVAAKDATSDSGVTK